MVGLSNTGLWYHTLILFWDPVRKGSQLWNKSLYFFPLVTSKSRIVFSAGQWLFEAPQKDISDVGSWLRHPGSVYMGGCQNRDPFLGTLNIRCRTILGTQEGTIILTTTYIRKHPMLRVEGFGSTLKHKKDWPPTGFCSLGLGAEAQHLATIE